MHFISCDIFYIKRSDLNTSKFILGLFLDINVIPWSGRLQIGFCKIHKKYFQRYYIKSNMQMIVSLATFKQHSILKRICQVQTILWVTRHTVNWSAAFIKFLLNNFAFWSVWRQFHWFLGITRIINVYGVNFIGSLNNPKYWNV